MNGDNVGMVHLTGCVSFIAEATQQFVVLDCINVEARSLESDGSANRRIDCPIDHAHRSAS